MSESLKNIKLLYVEDDPEAREELTDVLKRRCGRILTGENGSRGVALYEDFRPDIILADLYMPEMDGIEMIRQIRQMGGDPAVLVLSAVSDVDTILSAVDAGISKYVLKPVNLKELLCSLEELAQSVLSRRSAGRELMPEKKKQAESEIKKDFAAFLKASTGKGPRDVSVFIRDDQIEILASEVLTLYEKNLLDNYQNIIIIKHIRELFYSAKESDICQLVRSSLNRKVRLKEVAVNVEKDRNKLILTIEQDV